jgi:hypothetical protein
MSQPTAIPKEAHSSSVALYDGFAPLQLLGEVEIEERATVDDDPLPLSLGKIIPSPPHDRGRPSKGGKGVGKDLLLQKSHEYCCVILGVWMTLMNNAK